MYSPIRKVSTYHSRRPQLIGWSSDLVRLIWPRSTANTPIWQVTLDSSRTVVFVEPSAMLRCAPGQASPEPLSTDLTVKYIANNAAKNISSDESQTMVPTLTRLGLLAGVRGAVSTVAVATKQLLRQPVGDRHATPRVGDAASKCSRHPGALRAAGRSRRPAGTRRPPTLASRHRTALTIGTMQCHEGRCVQPRRGCPGPGQARHRASSRDGRAGRRDHRGSHGACAVPAARRGRRGRDGPRRGGPAGRRDGRVPPGQGRDLQLPAGAADRRPGRRRLAGHLVAGRRRGQPPDRPDRAGRRTGRADAGTPRGQQLRPYSFHAERAGFTPRRPTSLALLTPDPPGSPSWMPEPPGPRCCPPSSAVTRSPPM